MASWLATREKLNLYTAMIHFPILLSLLLLSLATQASTLRVETCADYHCDLPVYVELAQPDIEEIRHLFDQVKTSADERERIALAIGRFEQLVGQQNGTWRDKARNPGTIEHQGQLDCIAESRNTSTYLELLNQLKVLRWHKVEPRVVRHRYFFAAHWTAVIEEMQTSDQYAVDSWHDDNGEPARIVPLEAWYRGEEARL